MSLSNECVLLLLQQIFHAIVGVNNTQTLGTAKFVGGENCINRRHPASSSFPSLSSLHPATQQLSQPPPSIFRSSNSITHSPNLSHLYCGSANQSSPGVVQIGGGCPDPIRTSPPDLDTPLGLGPGPGWTPLPRIRMDDSGAYGGHFTADAACVKAFAYASVG